MGWRALWVDVVADDANEDVSVSVVGHDGLFQSIFHRQIRSSRLTGGLLRDRMLG